MFVVIFRAEIKSLDPAYLKTAADLRDLALQEYGCLSFHACNQGNREIAVSYWNSLEDVKRWKVNAQHLRAQALGRSDWYSTYQVEVAEVLRAYGADAGSD
ncbi:MAG: antibiotic biosynthesis monooxygenase family protein [Oceanococcus sp.]